MPTLPAAIAARVDGVGRMLGLEALLDRYPRQMSGGQRQRVAMGRAIARRPQLFLFDEPLSNLDAALRAEVRVEIKKLHRELGATMVYVTHDQVEAMTMADKIVVLRAGNIEQVGSPLELYRAPRNLFVAGFIGSPKMNLIPGPPAEAEGATTIGIRPEHLAVSTDSGTWEGTVGVSEHLGSDTFLQVNVPDLGEPLTVRVSGEIDLRYGSRVFVTPDRANLHRFDADGLRIA